MKSYKYILKGKVQGVYFRATTKQKADDLGVKGIVKNLPNGAVHVEAEASSEILLKFEEYLHSDPKNAKVNSLEKEEIEYKNYTSFEILH